LTTEGEGKGKVLWKDITVAASVVAANQKGTLSLPADPRVSEGKVGHVLLTVPSHPDLHAELDIPVRYDYSVSANFAGSGGSSGFDGSDRSDGMSCTMGSLDPTNPSPGGNGSDGSNGSDGGSGGPGGNGPDVHVLVALKSGNHTLLEVRVSAGRDERFYLVDPQGGSLSVNSEGGPGGSGGKGGPGRPGWLRWNWNAEREQRTRWLKWTRWFERVIGKGRSHCRDLRSRSSALLGGNPPLQSGWPVPEIQARAHGSFVVSAACPDRSFQGRVQNSIRELSDPSPSASAEKSNRRPRL
jgi:hypothetical protein